MSRISSRGKVWIATLTLTVVAAPTQASLVEFNDRDAWLAAAGTATTIDFVGLTDGETISDQYADLGVLFTSTSPVFAPTAKDLDAFGDGEGIRGEVDVVIELDVPVHAVALDIAPGGAVDIVRIFDAEGAAIGDAGVFTGPFGGIVSETPIHSVLIANGLSPVFADNILLGAPIPGPGALPLLALVLGTGRRRRTA